jgi:hypothetical protein
MLNTVSVLILELNLLVRQFAKSNKGNLTMAGRIVEHKNAIQMGHFTNLGAVAGEIADGDKTPRVIGYVVGKATGVSFRSNPNGSEPTLALTGLFEAISVNEGQPPMVAPVIFLPTAFVKSVGAVLMGEKKWPDKAPPKGKSIDIEGTGEVPLALEIGIRKNSGAGVGYEFAVTSRSDENEKTDALHELRQFLPAQLAQRTAPKQLAAPAKGKKKK